MWKKLTCCQLLCTKHVVVHMKELWFGAPRGRRVSLFFTASNISCPRLYSNFVNSTTGRLSSLWGLSFSALICAAEGSEGRDHDLCKRAVLFLSFLLLFFSYVQVLRKNARRHGVGSGGAEALGAPHATGTRGRARGSFNATLRYRLHGHTFLHVDDQRSFVLHPLPP